MLNPTPAKGLDLIPPNGAKWDTISLFGNKFKLD